MNDDMRIAIEVDGKRYSLADIPDNTLHEVLLQIERCRHTGSIDTACLRQQIEGRRQQLAIQLERIRSLGYSNEDVLMALGVVAEPAPVHTTTNTVNGRLYIVTHEGRIQEPTSRRTLLEGIRLAGFSRVYDMHIQYMKGFLVDTIPNPYFPKLTFHEGDYYITINNSDVPRMKRIAEQINAHLCLGWTVGIN